MSFSSNTSSGYSFDIPDPPGELFNIISVQSSARPGCIIELDAFTDAKQVHSLHIQAASQVTLVCAGSDPIQHKLACTVTEEGLKLKILDLRNTGILLSMKQKQFNVHLLSM